MKKNLELTYNNNNENKLVLNKKNYITMIIPIVLVLLLIVVLIVCVKIFNSPSKKINNYLDIGLHDTMKDLIVNFIGAFTYSIFGYLYIINKDKLKLAAKFLIKKDET